MPTASPVSRFRLIGKQLLHSGLINGSGAGPVLTTTPGHQYAFATQLICNEAQRVHQTYLSSTHPAGNGRGGDAIAAALRVVLTVHDVDPDNPGTLAAPATVLYDDVLPTPPGFATYALINGAALYAERFLHAPAAHC